MKAASPLADGTDFGTVADPCLAVVLRREAGQPVLAREAVRPGDLCDAVSEAWRECYLRRGKMDQAEGSLDLRVVPMPSTKGPPKLAGYALEGADAGAASRPARCEFSIYSLRSVARRAQAPLIADGILESGEVVYYELEATAPGRPAALPAGDERFETTRRRFPLHYLKVPLAPLLEAARSEGGGSSDAFPMFYTEEAFADAERFSRQGVELNPNFESGAVLGGHLCSCPATGEFFTVVTDIFEVTDAQASLVSLEYSGESWKRIQTVIKARQIADPTMRLLGQAHGHNFLPNGGKTCEECPKLETCSSSNVFASTDDHDWTRAVFAHQPWALCHIFGMTARGDLEQGLFTLQDGRLLERRFHVLPTFDADAYHCVTVNH